jgi:hypothetical protein
MFMMIMTMMILKVEQVAGKKRRKMNTEFWWGNLQENSPL